MNGYLWKVRRVNPASVYLVDRTNTHRVATTDPRTLTIYLSDELSGDFLRTVLKHELGHCTMFSYNLLSAIHDFVEPRNWVRAEEWICNFIADYGEEVLLIASYILADERNNIPRLTA